MNQVAQWLAFSPEQKRQYMDERTQAVELADMSHPAYRRFKEVIEPWGLRKKEHALHFRKVGLANPAYIALLKTGSPELFFSFAA